MTAWATAILAAALAVLVLLGIVGLILGIGWQVANAVTLVLTRGGRK